MFSSIKTISNKNTKNAVSPLLETTVSNGLFAELQLFCLLYVVVTFLLIIVLAESINAYLSVIGMTVLVTSYVVGLMIKLVLCGDCDELHR